jgi:hypothetical protein
MASTDIIPSDDFNFISIWLDAMAGAFRDRKDVLRHYSTRYDPEFLEGGKPMHISLKLEIEREDGRAISIWLDEKAIPKASAGDQPPAQGLPRPSPKIRPAPLYLRKMG